MDKKDRPVNGEILTDKQREYLKLSKWDGVYPKVTRQMLRKTQREVNK